MREVARASASGLRNGFDLDAQVDVHIEAA
jgi:hypothetical protein